MKRLGLILTILLTLINVPTRAQSQRDSIDTHEWAAKVSGEQGQLQSRYLPKGDSTAQDYVRKTHWYNRFRVGLGTGYNGQYNKNEISYSVPINATLAYQISPVHALQGKLSYAELQRENKREIRSASAELDYFLNFTNYTRGFNTNRVATFSGFIGMGGRLSSNEGIRQKSPYGVVGCDVTLALGNNISLAIQPYVGVIRNQPYLYPEQNNTFYEIMYGVNANLQLDFMRRRFTGRKLTSSTFFLETAQGLTIPTGNRESTSIGSAYTFAFGYWPNRILGMRLAAYAQDYYWQRSTTGPVVINGQQVHTNYTTRQRGFLLGGRLEMILAPFNTFAKWRNNKYVDLNIAAGMEYGKFGKAGYGLLIQNLGATMSTQILFKLPKTNNAMLFIEPRYSWIFYNIPYYNTSNKQHNKEGFAILSAGMRISRDIPNKQTNDTTNVYEKSAEPAKFFASIAWGDMRVLTRHETYVGKHLFNNSILASFGRDFCPWATAVLQIDYTHSHTASQQPYSVTVAGAVKNYNGMWNLNYHDLSVRLLYQLRLNNFIGYRNSRQRIQLFATTGPVFYAKIKGRRELAKGEMAGGFNPKLTNHIPGTRGTMSWAAGLQARIHVKNNWSIYIEPIAQLQFRSISNRVYLYDHIGVNYSF